MNLSPRHADLILKFLSNTNIVGGDAPIFMECIVLLQAIAQQQPSGEETKTNGLDASSIVIDPTRT